LRILATRLRTGRLYSSRRAKTSPPRARIATAAGHLGSPDAGTVDRGGSVSFDIGRLALVAIAVALWVAVFQGFNAF
jgi:hypothetical protein